MIDRFEISGLIEMRETFDGGTAFWVRDSVRPELARYVRRTRGAELEADVAELSRSSRLGTLTRYRADPSGLALMDRVEALIEDGRLGEATRLTASARLLGEALNEPLADAARRTRWRIDRAIRTAEDRRRLAHYVHRQSVEAEFRKLTEAHSKYYALHLLGDGGTGKTMVIRYLRSASTTPVARIDFDYLDPRYPDQRPGEILLAFAGELLGHRATREIYAGYRRLRDTVDAVHEELASDIHSGRVRPALEDMTTAFAQFIKSFRQSVLLVLDTCEELAKLYLPGTEAPAIDQTFRILEQVHSKVPNVRFLLAGRRWLVPPPDKNAAVAGPRLRRRDYLRVLTFTGFTRDEAIAYTRLRQVPSGAMTDALLRRAEAPGKSYNPFELAAYCEWALNDPSLNPTELLIARGDPLIERRIIGRMGDRIRVAVPIAAALGRFDLEMISPALRRSGLDPATAFRELVSQEWMSTRSIDDAGRPRVIEVDEHLRHRILTATTARYPINRPALGRDAAAMIERFGLSELPVETVEAAVRLLPATEAGAFWAILEQRILAEHAWGWAAQTTVRAAAVEAERDGPTILAAILATQAAARIHTANAGDVIPLWREVQHYADRHPDPLLARRLNLRGELGRIAAGEPRMDPALISDQQDGELVGSYLAAAQRRVADGHDATELAHTARRHSQDWRISALAASLLAVLALRRGLPADANALAGLAIDHASTEGSTEEWADWVPPRRILDRCRLTRLFVAFVRGEAPSDTEQRWEAWRDEAAEHLDDIDTERLVSLALRYEQGYRNVSPDRLRQIAALERYAPRRPDDWLHFQIRPLRVELAMQSWTDFDDSFGMLQERVDEAVAAGDDPDVVDACQLAQARLCRLHRYVHPQIPQLSLDAAPLVRAEAWLVRALVDGEFPGTIEEAGSWHGMWQCQPSRLQLQEPPATDPGIPPDVRHADIRDYRQFSGLPPGDVPRQSSIDPEQILRADGRIDGFSPGECGRAQLAVGEVLTLRADPRVAPLLQTAVELLSVAGDVVRAAQADILAVLAMARTGKRPNIGRSGPAWRHADLPRTWDSRLEIALQLCAGDPLPDDANTSPEFQFPSASSARNHGDITGAIAGRLGVGTPAVSDAFAGNCPRPRRIGDTLANPARAGPLASCNCHVCGRGDRAHGRHRDRVHPRWRRIPSQRS